MKGRIAGLAGWLGLGLMVAGGSAGAVDLRTVKFEGVSIGMTVAELQWTLESNGFREDERFYRRYIETSTDQKKRIRYRDLPGKDGAHIVYELDYTLWYPKEGFDAAAIRAGIEERFGPPSQATEPSVGRTELVYLSNPAAPTLGQVADACQQEIQKQNPQMNATNAAAKAAAAAGYHAANDKIQKTCPSVAPMYREFAEAIEAPRMTVVIRKGRVDTMVRWPFVTAELMRAGQDPVLVRVKMEEEEKKKRPPPELPPAMKLPKPAE